MDDVIDRIMNSAMAEKLPQVSGQNEYIREKVKGYIEALSSAGRRDADQLTEYGLAYLRNLFEGPDARYTGC